MLLKNVLENVRRDSPDLDDKYFCTSKIMVTTCEDDTVVLTPQKIRQRATLTRRGLLNGSNLFKDGVKSASFLVRRSVLNLYNEKAEHEKLIRAITPNKTKI